MRLREIVDELHLSVRTGDERLDQEVTGGYAGDLLSDVIAWSRMGQLWVTMQVNVNIVSVAVLKNLAGIVIVRGRQPDEDAVKKAVEAKIPIIISDMPAFETVSKIYGLVWSRG